MRLDDYIEPKVLYSSTALVAGSQIDQDFDNIKNSKGGRYGYLVGVDVALQCTMKQSQATAVLAVGVVHDFLAEFELFANEHEFTPNKLTGAQLRALGLLDGCQHNGVGDHTAALANTTDDTAVDQRYSFRCAPHPLRLFGDKGRVRALIGSTTSGDWVIKAATTMTCTITLQILWTTRKLVTRPTVVKVEPITKTLQTTNPAKGKTDCMFLVDDADVLAAISDGGADVKVMLDDETVFDAITLTELKQVMQARTDISLATVSSLGIFPLVMPTGKNRDGMIDTSELAGYSYGERYELTNAMNGNSSSNSVLVRRVHQDAAPEQMTLWAAAFGLDIGGMTKEQIAARMFLASPSPIGPLTDDQRSCMQLEWR